MLAIDRDAVICDLAETYGIFDMKRVPVKLLCTLAAGLGPNSRIKTKMNGLKAPWDIVLLAKICDLLMGNKNKKDQLLSQFLEPEEKVKEESDVKTFDSIEAFKAARAAVLGEK